VRCRVSNYIKVIGISVIHSLNYYITAHLTSHSTARSYYVSFDVPYSGGFNINIHK